MGALADLMDLMAGQHGVASTRQARALGVTRRVERRLIAGGVLLEPTPGVLQLAGAPSTFVARAMAATSAPGVVAVSHGAAARLHGLDGFQAHDVVDLIAGRGADPRPARGVVVHRTRGDIAGHVVDVGAVPVLSIGATLALLAPAAGVRATARALDSAIRGGADPADLRDAAQAWRRRGRAGPDALLTLLDRHPAGPAAGSPESRSL